MFNFNMVEFVKSKNGGIVPKEWFLEKYMTKCFYPPDKNYKRALNFSANYFLGQVT